MGDTASMLLSLIPLVLIFVVMYFLLIRPQRKKDKEQQQMRNNLEVGDEVVTIGGIIGMVVSLKEDNVVIETAGERNKIRIKRWAIQSNETVHDAEEEAAKALKAEKAAAAHKRCGGCCFTGFMIILRLPQLLLRPYPLSSL